MFKKIVISIGAILTIGVLALFNVGSVYAQSPTPPVPDAPIGNAWGRICDGVGVVSEAITNLLGMTSEEIYTERTNGKTLSDLAAEKGVNDQQLIDAILEGRSDAINQAVTDGRISQEQADWMLEKMETVAPLMIDNPFGTGGMGGMHGGRGSRHAAWGMPATETTP